MRITGPDFFLTRDEIEDPAFAEALEACGQQGDNTENVKALLRDSRWNISADPADARDILRAYGAWEDEELEDDDRNLERLVWLAGSDLAESGEVYFSTY